MLQTMPTQRVHSLDILRASGMFVVLLWHSPKTLHPYYGPIGEIGWLAIDLFFILSGYLITAQVFEAFVNKNEFSITKFYIRRGLRTLPVYWVMLAIYFLVPLARTSNDTPPLWEYLLFTVNFHQRQGINFGHVWSLCVEEQFYF
ncbi:MAG: acyltransferase, partial [Bdellovibrionota bacterium]